MVDWANRHPLSMFVMTCLIVLVAGNAWIGSWSSRLPYRRKLAEIARAGNPNLLFVGNSLLDGHTDEADLELAAYQRGMILRSLNAALGATQPPEQELLFKDAIQSHPSLRMLVIGAYDLQLTSEPQTRVDDLVGNRMVGIDSRFSMQEVRNAYSFDQGQQLAVELLRTFPLAANRGSAWRDVEVLRRRMGQIGMPHLATNSMGRVSDFDALEGGSVEEFDAQIERFLRSNRRFNSSYRAILQEAHDRDMGVVILIMPMSPYHRQTYYSRSSWRTYLEALRQMAAREHVSVIDASGWIPDQDGFVDHLHLAPGAVGPFSTMLGNALAALPNLRSTPVDFSHP